MINIFLRRTMALFDLSDKGNRKIPKVMSKPDAQNKLAGRKLTNETNFLDNNKTEKF